MSPVKVRMGTPKVSYIVIFLFINEPIFITIWREIISGTCKYEAPAYVHLSIVQISCCLSAPLLEPYSLKVVPSVTLKWKQTVIFVCSSRSVYNRDRIPAWIYDLGCLTTLNKIIINKTDELYALLTSTHLLANIYRCVFGFFSLSPVTTYVSPSFSEYTRKNIISCTANNWCLLFAAQKLNLLIHTIIRHKFRNQ